MKHLVLAASVSACLFACSSTQPGEPNQDGQENHENQEEEKGLPWGAMHYWSRRLDADGTVPPNAVARMKEQRDARVLGVQPEETKTVLENGLALGPGNIGGRIRGLVIHPTKPNIMWAGSVGGGIWKTTNGGAAWAPLDDFAPVMAVGCLVLDPKNPDTIYAGTGEGFFDSVEGTSNLAGIRGAGIFVSTNGGTKWTQLSSTKGSDFHLVTRIAISPKDSKVILAATSTGIFRSADTGKTWAKKANVFAMDVDFHPTDDKQAIAGVRDGTAMYSTDGGSTWKAATGMTKFQRVETAYAQSSPKTVYAAVSQSDRIKIYQSTDGGQKYTLKTTGSGVSTWSRYTGVLWVDPTNPAVVVFGGVNLYRSTNSGASYSSISGLHPDHHVMAHHPSYNGSTNQTVFIGNDGGVFRTTTMRASRVSWTELNNNLQVTQFYGAAIAPNGRILGGTQDNGTILYTGNKEGWLRVIGGDGGFCAADPKDSNYLYGEVYWIRIYRSTNGGTRFTRIASASNIKDKGSNFIPPFILDPNNVNRMYFGGASLWRSNNIKATTSTPTWTEVKKALTCSGGAAPGVNDLGNAHFRVDPPCNISAISAAPGNADIVWVGHNHGDIYMTTNATATSPTWKRVDASAQPNRWVSRIAIDPQNNKRVYVSFLGYHQDNVWKTTNGGTTWTKITGSGTGALPASPVSTITVHPKLAGCLFIGTDIGIYCSTNDGLSWSTTTQGSATSPVEELLWQNDRKLVVATHGRGVFTFDVGRSASSKPVGTGCGKATNPPTLSATNPVLGKTQTYQVAGAAASSPVWLYLSAGTPPAVNLGNNCTFRIGGPVTLLITGTNTSTTGAWSYNLNVPVAKVLLNQAVTAQAAILVNGGPALGVAELTNGVVMTGGW